MQKIVLPVIFLAAVGATLYYVSVEEHGAGTLFLLGAVLLVGQICSTLPFIFEAKKPPAGTPSSMLEMQKKALANQRVIQDDTRALGEALIKRLNAISERQSALEKKLESVASAEDLDANFDELFKKFDHALEERFEALRESAEELFSNHVATLGETLPAKEDFLRHFENTAEQLEETLCTLANFSATTEEDAEDAAEDETVSAGDEADAEEKIVPENEEAGANDENLDDFPEESEDEENATQPEPHEDAPAPAEAENSPRNRSTLILDAMFGIENKPFLRGNAPGLSLDRGVPMNFVEIGIWRFDFEPSAEEFSVTIHLNDAPEPLGDPIVLAPGQTLEIRPTP